MTSRPWPPIHLSLVSLIFYASLAASCTGTRDNVPQPDSAASAKQGTPQSITNLPKFDGDEAYKYVVKQVAYGPRNPNSAGHDSTLHYLISELSKYTSSVTQQDFVHNGYGGEKLNLSNVIGSFNPTATKRI